MATHRIPALLTAAWIAGTVCACSSIGPPTVQRDRLDYGSAIGDSWKQQTLLNVVKLRYGDMPVFLEIAQVIAGYEMESTAGAGIEGESTTSSLPDLLTFGGSALAQGKYTDRPTLIYAALTGTDFLKKLMTPIPPSAVLFLLQAGYAADLVIPIAISSINGVSNESRRNVNRAADPHFVRLVQLLRELQLADAVQVRIASAKGEPEITLLVFPPSADPELAAKGAEVRSILGLKPGARELRVYYGGHSGKSDEISMMTRSMLQIMMELATIVQVPAEDVDSGRAAPGVVEVRAGDPQPHLLLDILSGETPPRDAFVAVPYGDRWFWISSTDIRSKFSFGFVMLLFSISETGVSGSEPVVTVPTN